jgi:hypothetical protein
MRKYPVLRGLSGLARFIGWAGLVLGGVCLIVGLLEVLSANVSAPRYQGDAGILGFYSGLGAFSVGVGLSIASVYLIILGEVINVFVDIEDNTSETVRLLRSLVGTRLDDRMTVDSSRSAEAEAPKVERRPVPAGFQEAKRKIEVGDEIFHPTAGLGVATRPGRDRYFVWVRLHDTQQEKELERFGLYQKGT